VGIFTGGSGNCKSVVTGRKEISSGSRRARRRRGSRNEKSPLGGLQPNAGRKKKKKERALPSFSILGGEKRTVAFFVAFTLGKKGDSSVRERNYLSYSFLRKKRGRVECVQHPRRKRE